jgi:hypothetical protein
MIVSIVSHPCTAPPSVNHAAAHRRQSVNAENIRPTGLRRSLHPFEGGYFKMLGCMMRRWWRHGASHKIREPVRVGTTKVLRDCSRRSLFIFFDKGVACSWLSALSCGCRSCWRHRRHCPAWPPNSGSSPWCHSASPPSLEDLNTREDCSYYRKIARIA